MAVLSRLLVGSQQRIDLPDILAIESYVASDFKHLIKSFVGTTPMILKGFEIIDAPLCINTVSVSIRVANSVLYNPLSSSGCFFYGLEEGNSLAEPLTPDLRKNATNYIYVVVSSEGSASDSRAFWDVDLNSGEGGEFNQIVNTQSVIKVEVGVSVSAFPEGSVPIAKVELDSSSITKITDCRNMMFRLGTGGSSPNSLNTYSFKSLPSSSYTRDEPSLYVENTTSPTPFFGGDKNIFSLKEWMDVVMTKLLELSGTTYWYESTPTINILNLFDDTLGSSIKSKGRWTHDLASPGKIIWSEDIVYRKMNDPRDIIIRSNVSGITLNNDEVMYVDMLRNKQINSLNDPVIFLNNTSHVNGSLGSFENLSQGDWIKKSIDNDNLYLRVERFWTGLNKSGSSTTNPSNALSIELSGTYQGTSDTSVATYTKGQYTNSDIKVSSRSSSEPWSLGGQFYWLANRSDTVQKISLIQAKDVSANITKANGKRAIIDFIATPHGLVDGDRIVITDSSGSELSGYGNNPYQIEKESDTTVIIQTSSKLNYTGIKVRWAVVTTDANYSSASGDTYLLESANHNFESNQKIKISDTSSLHDGDYYINYRNNTQFQIPSLAAGNVSIGKATCARVNLRTEFGAAKVIQGESLDINEPDSKNILDFIGMTSLAQSNPVYFLPESTNTLQGVQNFNSDANDSLTARVSKLTAMMADRVQDRGSIVGGRVVFRNTQNSIYQKIIVGDGFSSNTLFIERPGSPRQTINLPTDFSLSENQALIIQISRESDTSITPTVEDLVPTSGGRFALEENKIILFYRFSGTSVYSWTGIEIKSSGSWTSNDHENAQNKNISIIDTAGVALNTTGTPWYLYYRYSSGSVTIKINGSSNDNVIDAASINTIQQSPARVSIENNECAWIRINRAKSKTFTNITTNSSTQDSDSNGYVYITSTSSVPADEDVFVIYIRANNVLNTMHHVNPVGNIYEEKIILSSDYPGFPTQTYVANLPLDSRNQNSSRSYINGSGQLQVYLNGQKLIIDEDYQESSSLGNAASSVTILVPLLVGDILTFRIESGAVYFASSGTSVSLQTAYLTGSSVSIQSGNPISLNASTNTALNITGKLEVTGPVIVKSQNDIRLFDSDSSNYVGFRAPLNLTADKIWTLPSVDGTSGQVLTTLGNGTLSWSSPSGTSSNYVLKAGDEMTGDLYISESSGVSTGSIKLKEKVGVPGNNGRYVGFKAPTSLSTISVEWTLPNQDGLSGNALITDGSGVLSWASIPSTSLFVQKTGDTITGPLVMNSQNEIRFAGSGVTYVGFKAKSTVPANKIWTLPDADGTSGQALVTDGSGSLSWSSPSVSGPIYSVNSGKSAKIYSKTASDALANKFTLNTNWKNISFPYNTTDVVLGNCWSPELGIFCAVGTSGMAMTSYDGDNWTPRTTLNTTDNWYSVCWSSALGLFCAVGRGASTGGRIMTSPDGINWTSRTSNIPSGATSSQFVSICWSPELGVFCAVADFGLTNDRRIIYSYDGITWSIAIQSAGTTNTPATTSGLYDRPWEKVVWSPELNLFVAIAGFGVQSVQYPTGTGNRSGGTSGAYLNSIITSPDGVNWTLQSTSSTVLYNDICWCAELKKFVATMNTQSVSGYTWTSTDGTNWTETTDSISTFFSRQRISWVSELGLFFIATNGPLLYSSDGVTLLTSGSIGISSSSSYSICWSSELGKLCVSNSTKLYITKDLGFYSPRKVIPKYFHLTAQASEAVRVVSKWYPRTISTNGGFSVCWSPELGIFCSVSSTNSSINTSPDGITWTNRTSPSILIALYSVCWSSELGRFCAVGLDTGSGQNLGVLTSSNGVNWTGNTPVELNTWRSICWSPELGLFCAVSSDGTNRVMTSSTGLIGSWTNTGLTGVAANQWVSVCWSPELRLFCAVSIDGTNRVMTSPDGTNWTARTAAASNQWYSICWSSELGLFCAVSADGTNRVMTSPDGTNWTARTAAAANQWDSICWSSELRLFCAVSIDGTNRVMTSPDGTNWTVRSSGDDASSWYSVCWSPELSIFCSVAMSGTNKAMTSKKANLLSEILNLKTSRLYY